MMAQLENGRLSSDDTMSVMTLNSQFDEESSFGSDSEINGFTSSRLTDKYGFIGGAQQYSSDMAQEVSLAVLRQREAKWLDMLNHWDKWISKRFKKLYKAFAGSETSSGSTALSERYPSITKRQGLAVPVRRKSEEGTEHWDLWGVGLSGWRPKVG